MIAPADAGHIWGEGEMARDAAGFAAAEAQTARGIASGTISFRQLCLDTGYNSQRPKLLAALAGVYSRSHAMEVLLPLVFEIENRNALADAWVRELSSSVRRAA